MPAHDPMPERLVRPTCLRALALLAALGLWTAWGAAQVDVPTSTKLLYLPEKNFRVGDWVLYEVQAENVTGEASFDYQRVQVVSEERYRGDDCFWLETGWGPYLDALAYTTVLISETIFQDSLAEVRTDVHVRRIHVSTTADGRAVMAEGRLATQRSPMSDLQRLMPRRTAIGRDTVNVGERTFDCVIQEEIQEYSETQDLPDSTVRFFNRVTRRRWIDPKIPITALAREYERKEFYRHAWPLGRLSSEFPMLLTNGYEIQVQLADLGTGAKPVLSDRVISVQSRARGEGAGP
jgi:hypothetical protein